MNGAKLTLTQTRVPHVSNWIKFFRQYGPIPRNGNMYDESIQESAKRWKMEPVRIEAEYLPLLEKNFGSDSPRSVILTGTAGDGKTYYCREIWQKLGGTLQDWEKENTIKTLQVGHRQIVFIKDLSEVSDHDKDNHLPVMSRVFAGEDDSRVYLIAANDGQLVEAWAKAGNDLLIKRVRKEIEELLVGDRRQSQTLQFDLYNLSLTKATIVFERILNAVLNHPGWGECSQCIFQVGDGQGRRCPIWENRQRLNNQGGQSVVAQRLTDLLELCELDGIHLPIRQMLLLVANLILGYPDRKGTKDYLLSCKDIGKIENPEQASLYRNAFGENLPERQREAREVFTALGRFGIGVESSNFLDNVLIFGADDPNLKPFYEELVLQDTFYGASANYQEVQRKYLEGEEAANQDFLPMLRAQRQRLFFTVPPHLRREFKLWDLTIFHYADEYLNEVYRGLDRGEKIAKHIVGRLVRGLNRIFIGLLANNQNELVLATSGSYSQAKVSRVFEETISVSPKRGEKITIERLSETGKPSLTVWLSTNRSVALPLTLTRYEYLSRVAEGGLLPSSFSRECYEDILAFKTRVLRRLLERRHEESEELEIGGILTLRLILELSADGTVHTPTTLEIKL